MKGGFRKNDFNRPTRDRKILLYSPIQGFPLVNSGGQARIVNVVHITLTTTNKCLFIETSGMIGTAKTSSMTLDHQDMTVPQNAVLRTPYESVL